MKLILEDDFEMAEKNKNSSQCKPLTKLQSTNLTSLINGKMKFKICNHESSRQYFTCPKYLGNTRWDYTARIIKFSMRNYPITKFKQLKNLLSQIYITEHHCNNIQKMYETYLSVTDKLKEFININGINLPLRCFD